MLMTLMAVVAGMIFSLSIALLAEELIFGQVFRLFFSQQAAVKAQTKRQVIAPTWLWRVSKQYRAGSPGPRIRRI